MHQRLMKYYRYIGPTHYQKGQRFATNCLLEVSEECLCPITKSKWLYLNDLDMYIRVINPEHFVEVMKKPT